jgi:hypothetical protein
MVLPTLAVLVSWLFVAAVVAGCGFLTRRLVLAYFSEPGDGLACADLWIGFAVLVAYLEIWNLTLPIRLLAWIAPLACGGVGLVLAARRSPRFARKAPLALVSALAVAILWLANKALGPAEDYDLGLYHFGVIGYALKYASIPGLGNLQVRLSAGDAHLLFVALLEHGPWANAGFHLADGLLVALLLVELCSRIGRPPGWQTSFTARMAMLLVPATVVVVGIRPTHRLSSPNLDLATYVLVVVGALYLAECVERGYRPTAIMGSTASFAVAAATRPLYWIPTALAAGLIALAAGRDRPHIRLRAVRAVILGCTIPGAVLVGWAGRQAILSGYPLYPLRIGGLHADWRVPASVVRSETRGDYAWARWPGIPPDTVLGSWHWLGAYWFKRRKGDLDVLSPLLLLGSLVPALAFAWTRDSQRSRRLAPMLAVLVPSLVVLVVWFLTAPDPRFAFAPLWLVPIAIAAWAAPPPTVRRYAPLLILAVVLAALITVGVEQPTWLVPAAFIGSTIATIALLITKRGHMLAIGSEVAIVAAMLAPIGVVADHGAFAIVSSSQGGPLGTPPERVPQLQPFFTASGLQLVQPVDTDQCFLIELCTTNGNPEFRLRGAGIEKGFSVEPKGRANG